MSKHHGSHGMTTQAQLNHHANQCNPNNHAHQAALDNHANQCNPNNSAHPSRQGGSGQAPGKA